MNKEKAIEKLKLRINNFEIEVDDWCSKNNMFWLRHDDCNFLCINCNELEDLKEIIKRFEEKQELQ